MRVASNPPPDSSATHQHDQGDDSAGRTKAAVSAQLVASLGVIALVIIFVSAYHVALGDALWALAWGAVGIIAAVGVLFGFRVARWVSVVFSIVTGLAAAF